MADFFTELQAKIETLVPAGNVTQGMAGKIEWDTTVLTPAAGKTAISKLLDDSIQAFPPTMLPGGTAGDIVTAWVNPKNFLTMVTSTKQAYQFTKNGGVTSNYFQYVKEESTVMETRNMFRWEFLRYGNLIILPWNGLQADSLIITYQEGIEGQKVFFDKVPAALRNNLYIILKGMFVRNDGLSVPVEERGQQMFFDIPYQVGNLFAINKVENAIAKYKFIGRFSNGILLRESDKLYAYLPNAAS